MKISPKILHRVARSVVGSTVALAAIAWQAPARATDLVIVDQSMAQFVCMFDTDCSSSTVPHDIAPVPSGKDDLGPQLHSFSFEAKSSTPADGTTVYLYQVDLTETNKSSECVAGLVINFGSPAHLPAAIASAAQVFVIATDGSGTVAIKSVEQDGDFIQFNFDGAVCPGQSSLFFGLSSERPSIVSNATLFGYGNPPVTVVTAHTPSHQKLAPPRNLTVQVQ